jgi:hypothetical protein
LFSSNAFQAIDNPKCKIALLGADRKARNRLFLNVRALLLTEVYEYGLRLSNPTEINPHFLGYKVVYASILRDLGYNEEALK